MTAVARSILAEAIGTFALVFAGCGAIISLGPAIAIAYQVVSRQEVSP
jgi:glycerol uptake facilitator-like aquaporin